MLNELSSYLVPYLKVPREMYVFSIQSIVIDKK